MRVSRMQGDLAGVCQARARGMPGPRRVCGGWELRACSHSRNTFTRSLCCLTRRAFPFHFFFSSHLPLL